MESVKEKEEIKYGTGVTQFGYTDCYPWEVIKVISEQTLEIRAMRAELDPSWKPNITPGGFAGHCLNNQEQRWNLFSDPNGRVIRIRKKKDRDEWGYKGGRFKVGKAQKFHDYNF